MYCLFSFYFMRIGLLIGFLQNKTKTLSNTGSKIFYFEKLLLFENVIRKRCASGGEVDGITAITRRSCGTWRRLSRGLHSRLGRETVSINGSGACGVKNGLHGIAAMARSTNRSGEDGDPRVTAPTDRDASRDLAEPRELSLEEVLKSYEQPINEEQAWAVCYQCCSGLRVPRPPAGRVSRVKDPSSILLHRDGTVSLQREQGYDGRRGGRGYSQLSAILITKSKWGKSAF